MTSYEWAKRINETLSRLYIRPLSPAQLTEVEEIIVSAMQDAWKIGNGLNHGVSFSNTMMEV